MNNEDNRKQIQITEDRCIGPDQRCLVIAEVGINHNGSVEIAKKMIDAAKSAGADVVKFQTYKAEELISDTRQTYTYRSQGLEITESMIELLKRNEFNESQWIEINEHCKKSEILWATTPQNKKDIDFILSIVDVPLIKVGSDDLTNLELLNYYSGLGKPMIISAGMAYDYEIEDAISTVKAKTDKLVVLHCISSYPANVEEVNLRKMTHIHEKYNVMVGFSDHTIGNQASCTAVALGAKVVERHFTLSKDLPGPDHWFSANPKELNAWISAVREVETLMGSANLVPTLKEQGMRNLARRSVVAAREIKAGETICEGDLDVKRPGSGLPPKMLKNVINKIAKIDIEKGELITKKNVDY